MKRRLPLRTEPTNTNAAMTTPTLVLLEQENELLRTKITQLQQRLLTQQPQSDSEAAVVLKIVEDDDETKWCPINPKSTFWELLNERAGWLVGLLTLQSLSGFILSNNEELLQVHPVIVYFLTMLVGAGGNAGNQASVRVIRGIALGKLNHANTTKLFLQREMVMAFTLSVVLSCAGFLRAVVFDTPMLETIAVTTALALIVVISIGLGAVLPLVLRKLHVDPAHSSTTIQVVMDILGVLLTILVSRLILDFGSPTLRSPALTSYNNTTTTTTNYD